MKRPKNRHTPRPPGSQDSLPFDHDAAQSRRILPADSGALAPDRRILPPTCSTAAADAAQEDPAADPSPASRNSLRLPGLPVQHAASRGFLSLPTWQTILVLLRRLRQVTQADSKPSESANPTPQ
jgi:hypothetical protein